MNIYVIANLDFGSYAVSIKEQIRHFNNKIIENWNQVITEEDRIYIFGRFGGNNRKETREVLEKLKGNIYICSYIDNKRFTKDEWYSWNIYRVWDVNFSNIIEGKRIIFSSLKNYNNIANKEDYGAIWNREEDTVYKNNQLSIEAKYWDYTPILLDELFNIIDRLKELESMEDDK